MSMLQGEPVGATRLVESAYQSYVKGRPKNKTGFRLRTTGRCFTLPDRVWVQQSSVL